MGELPEWLSNIAELQGSRVVSVALARGAGARLEVLQGSGSVFIGLGCCHRSAQVSGYGLPFAFVGSLSTSSVPDGDHRDNGCLLGVENPVAGFLIELAPGPVRINPECL